MTNWFQWQQDDLVLQCRLQPKASSDDIVGLQDGALKIRITAPPVDGKANNHLIKYMAREFGVNRSAVCIEKGHKGRHKQVRIQSPGKFPAKLKSDLAKS